MLKNREIPVAKRSFETYRHNDYLFMNLMKGGLKKIFKTIMQLNAETLKTENPQLYSKIKFEEAIE